ncbi:MAG: 1,4-alpha-glucan branching protein GlgB [Clostridiales bacterium]|nr:1,4-alpha-glucan branching protein GlgB [Clostridiales bacterium]
MGISDFELYLFKEGTNRYAYRLFGAHFQNIGGIYGVRFSVWAPNAISVSVVGDFNGWDGGRNPMARIRDTGVWVAFIPKVKEYDIYKYQIRTADGETFLKSDPYAFYCENRPHTASKVVRLQGYDWKDAKWQNKKKEKDNYGNPMLIYEVHLGSWNRKKDGEFLTYREMAKELVDYVSYMGYTHIELLPLSEHPFDGSWGYQVTGYFAITSRFGTPYDFMYFVDRCHQKGIGVILDWVPSHFAKDAHGLVKFDGRALYEFEDPLQSEQKQWGTLNFNYGRKEVAAFLISNAIFWMDVYHVDGLRVDAVSSMLYLDFGKREGEWVPNRYGGRENLHAVKFLKNLNDAVSKEFKNALMIAEESSTWPNVTGPTYLGGLGFSYKWNMGWMNDILSYMSTDPIFRKWKHNNLTFSMTYAFSEKYILPLSHDEVVHGKKSLLNKMYGDYKQKFAGLRTLYGFMMAHPGKKLLFMGGEFGQFIEWRFDTKLDWNLLGFEMHSKIREYVRDLNHFYLNESSLWERDNGWDGFKWIEPNDFEQSVISFIRIGKDPKNILIAVCNFTPVKRENYRIGVIYPGEYCEALSSDDVKYGGSGKIDRSNIIAQSIPCHGMRYSISIKIPPVSAVFFKPLKLYDDLSLKYNDEAQLKS